MALRTVMSCILLFQIVMSMLAAESVGFFGFGPAGAPYSAHIAVYVLAPLMWFVYALVPLGLFKQFRSAEEMEETGESGGDTGGVSFDEVPRIKGYELEPYICPKITERIYQSTKRARRETTSIGLVSPRAPAAAETGAENA